MWYGYNHQVSYVLEEPPFDFLQRDIFKKSLLLYRWIVLRNYKSKRSEFCKYITGFNCVPTFTKNSRIRIHNFIWYAKSQNARNFKIPFQMTVLAGAVWRRRLFEITLEALTPLYCTIVLWWGQLSQNVILNTRT